MVARKAKVFGEMALRLALEEMGHQATKWFQSVEERATALEIKHERTGQVLLEGLSQLKGSGLKLLQNLALMDDLIPPPMLKKLEASFGAVSPLSPAVIRKLLRLELNTSPERVFRSFEEKAFAAASLGQVHRAKLLTGESVIVKIQYPHVARDLHMEIEILRKTASYLAQPLIQNAVQEVTEQLLTEVDYLQEARNSEIFRAYWTEKGILVPRVHKELSTSRLLVQDYAEGETLLAFLRTNTAPPTEALDSCFRFFFESLFQLQAIHADPHPGNFLVTTDRRLAVVDFGAAKLAIALPEINLLRCLLSTPLNESAVLLGYRSLGATIQEKEETDFLDEVVRPYHLAAGHILRPTPCALGEKREQIRELRRAIFRQSRNPKLQGFSTELSSVHKAMQNLLMMLARFNYVLTKQL